MKLTVDHFKKVFIKNEGPVGEEFAKIWAECKAGFFDKIGDLVSGRGARRHKR